MQSDLLGLVSTQVQSLKTQLNNTNFDIKLDAYKSSVEELSEHLELKVEAQCDVGSEIISLKDSASSEGVFKLIGQIFTCDNATSITFALGGENINQLSHGFLDSQGDSELQSLLNKNLHAASHRADDVANKAHELVRIHQAEMIADLMDTLDSTIDIDGNTVLDNTLIFWTSAMSNNTHQIEDFPHILLAGKNTNLNGGYHYNCTGSTNNDLLTTVAQGMHVPLTEFGGFDANKVKMPTVNNGPISKLLKTVLT